MKYFFGTTKFRFLATAVLSLLTIVALLAYYCNNTVTTNPAASEGLKSSTQQPTAPETTKSYHANVMEKARKISDDVRTPVAKLPLVQAFRSQVAVERTRFDQARNKLDQDVYASKSIDAQLSAAILAHNRAEIDDLNVKLEKGLAMAQASGVALNASYKTYMNALQIQVDHIDNLAAEK